MTLAMIMQQKNMSVYRLSKSSGIPYTTVYELYVGKSSLEKCTAETVYKIAAALDISMEKLIKPYLERRSDFTLFKSSVCHRLKELGDIQFLVDTLEQDDIRMYYDRCWYAESFYLLAMLDYISRLNRVPLCTRYDDIRQQKLETPLYPTGVLLIAAATDSKRVKAEALRSAIPEFMRFNIVENEVLDIA